MAYWITIKTAQVRRGMSADTLEKAIAVAEAQMAAGCEVRIIHPDGYEVNVTALRLLADLAKGALAPS